MKRKYVKPTIVLSLVAALAIGGTIAYLNDVTDEKVNEFTVKEVDIDLTESDNDYTLTPGKEFTKDPTITILKDESHVFTKVVETIPTAALAEKADGTNYGFKDYVYYDINTTCGTVYLYDATLNDGEGGVSTTGTPWEWKLIATSTDADLVNGDTKNTFVYALVKAGTEELLVVSSQDVMYAADGVTVIDTKYPILEGNKAAVPKELTQKMIDLLPAGTMSVDLSFRGYAIQTTALTDDAGNAVTSPEDIYDLAVEATK